MHTDMPSGQPDPAGARLARAAALVLRRAAARLDRAAQALERTAPREEEHHYAHLLLSSYGKLD